MAAGGQVNRFARKLFCPQLKRWKFLTLISYLYGGVGAISMIDWISVIACLEKAAGRKLAEHDLVARQITMLMDSCLQLPAVPKACRLSFALYGLAVLYAQLTRKMPGYSKSENSTHFERFVWLVLRPPEFLLTDNAIKTGIQKLALKQNPAFARDVQGAISKWSGDGDTTASPFDA